MCIRDRVKAQCRMRAARYCIVPVFQIDKIGIVAFREQCQCLHRIRDVYKRQDVDTREGEVIIITVK